MSQIDIDTEDISAIPTLPGLDGFDGQDGEQGPPGFSGTPGTPGTPGTIGPMGPPGLDAEFPDEPMIIVGPRGQIGITGATGIAGSIGPLGPPGIDGYDGEDGIIPGPPGLTGPPGTSGSWTEVEINLGTIPVYETNATIIDASVTVLSKIIAIQSGKAPTGKEADENEMDQINIACLPGSGLFTAYISTTPGPIINTFKFYYQVI